MTRHKHTYSKHSRKAIYRFALLIITAMVVFAGMTYLGHRLDLTTISSESLVYVFCDKILDAVFFQE